MTYLPTAASRRTRRYSTSFLPTGGVRLLRRAVRSDQGEQIEGGLKFQPKGSNGFLTGSVFEITQTNVRRARPDQPAQLIQQGEIRSRGFELEAVGHVRAGLCATTSPTPSSTRR